MSARHWKYDGWIIDPMSDEGHGPIGRFWWFDGKSPEIPGHMLGHRVASFETRREAREALKWVRRGFPKARVRKARFAIEVEP